MATRDDLVQRILDDLERDGSDWESRVVNEINTAIDFYQKKRFYFSDSRQVTFDTVADQDAYPFDTEFFRLDDVTIVVGGVATTLRRQDYTDIEASLANFNGNGQPWSYAYLNGGLRLYPKPNAVYQVRFLGHFKVPAPAEGDDADNPWVEEAFELIRCRAKMMLAIHVLADDGLAARMAAAEKPAFRALKTATYLKTGSGNITPTSF